jgi:hypothetical protein
MNLLKGIGLTVLLAGLLAVGCAQPERKPEKKSKTVRVRAPYTRVDVEIPEDEDDDVDVDVRVSP